MITSTTIEELAFPVDARGFVFEPVEADLLRLQQNVHVAVTEPGAIRGNHFHEHCTEIAIVVGPALVRIRENGQVQEKHVGEGKTVRFTFGPRVSHAFQNTGARPMLLIAFSTAPFQREAPDVQRDVLIDPGARPGVS